MPDLLADLRCAVRRWTKRRTFAITAILTIAPPILPCGEDTAASDAVLGVLLIACANVGGLLLGEARGAIVSRRRL